MAGREITVRRKVIYFNSRINLIGENEDIEACWGQKHMLHGMFQILINSRCLLGVLVWNIISNLKATVVIPCFPAKLD